MGSQYQHFVSKFLLKNFRIKGNPVYKCKNNEWTEHNVKKTGGEELFYGAENNSLEKFFDKLESMIAAIINFHQTITIEDKAYLKIFIQTLANRSPSKNEIISREIGNYGKILTEEIPDIAKRCAHLERIKKEQDNFLMSLKDDMILKGIIDKFPVFFNDSDQAKIFPDVTLAILQILPKVGKYFEVDILESDHDFVVGETPTMSVDVEKNEIKTNGEEAGLANKNAIYWTPIAYNKIAFMYRIDSFEITLNKKVLKNDVDMFNYLQKEKNPFYYSRIKNIGIPELSGKIDWNKYFKSRN